MKEDNKLTFGVNYKEIIDGTYTLLQNGKEVKSIEAIPNSTIFTRSALEERDRKMIANAFEAGGESAYRRTGQYGSFDVEGHKKDKQQYIDSIIKNNQS